jgi:hypothetical protein
VIDEEQLMALRDKLRDRVGSQLEPGEQVQQVLLSQTGLSPWFIPVIGAVIAMFVNKYYVVAVTDRNIVLLPASKLVPSKVKKNGAALRLPRSERFDVQGKLWGSAVLGGQKHFIHRRFFDDAKSADTQAG